MAQGSGIRKSGCLSRSAHNKATGKYVKQFARTAANKARRAARLKSVKSL